MEAFSSKHLVSLTSFLILLVSSSSSVTTHSANAHVQAKGKGSGSGRAYQEASTVFIRTSCSSTTYPRLCFSSLSKHAGFIQTNPVLLTGTALNVTLASAKSTSAVMSTLAKRQGLKPREVAAMRDCVEVLSDSVDELRRSIGEMSHLRNSNFEATMNDVQTWVSAALTDESTCTDGFQESSSATATATATGGSGDVKTTVRGKIVQVAQMTSNALALINQLASSSHA